MIKKQFYSSKYKTTLTELCLRTCGIQVNLETAELIWRIHNALAEKGDQLTMQEVIKISCEVRKSNQKP